MPEGMEAGDKSVEIIDIKTFEKRPPVPQHKNQLRLYGEAARIMALRGRGEGRRRPGP